MNGSCRLMARTELAQTAAMTQRAEGCMVLVDARRSLLYQASESGVYHFLIEQVAILVVERIEFQG